jgi:hypothetical protein
MYQAVMYKDRKPMTEKLGKILKNYFACPEIKRKNC